MPYTLKTSQISVKDPETGKYSGVDILAEQTEQGLIAELQAEGTTQVNRINQAAVDVQAAVDQAESDAATIISDTQTSINTLEAQKNTIAQTVASMAELGTDTTLSTPGMAADAGAVGDLNRQISDVESEITQLNYYFHPNMTDGSYVANNGDIGSNQAFALSDLIEIVDGMEVYSGMSQNYAIYYYNANKVGLSAQGAPTATATAQILKLNPPDDAVYFRFNTNKSKVVANDCYVVYPLPFKNQNDISNLNNAVFRTEQPNMTDGVYITNTGIVGDNALFALSDYILACKDMSVYAGMSVNYAVCYFDKNKNFINAQAGEQSPATAITLKLNVPTNAVYLRFNTLKSVVAADDCRIYYPLTEMNEGRLNENEYVNAPANILPMYDTFICIGDSLTASQVWTSENNVREAYKSYPDILASLNGATAYTYATPGDTAILWWSRSSEGAFSHHGLYIVFLGTNGGLTDTIATDCVGTDPDNFANTNTGQYGRILQTIANANDKAVLVIPWAGGGDSLAITKSVINQFGSKYSFAVIDVDSPDRANDYYHIFPNGSGKNDLHFNDLGYAWFANQIMNRINMLPTSEQWKISRKQ